MPGFRLRPDADAATVAAHLDAIERSLAASPHAERVVLVAGEVLSNVTEHGSEPVDVEWEESGGGTVVLTVRGRGPGAEQIHRATLPEPGATRGRGLFLVQALASAVSDGPDGLVLSFY